jgi:steroid 5-alpha reductase family enzyme
MFDLTIYAAGLVAALALAILTWLISIAKHDVNIVDPIWPIFFLVMAITYLSLAPALGERAQLVLFMVSIWSVRLLLFTLLRDRDKTLDGQHQENYTENQSKSWLDQLYGLFGLQAILAWIISLSLLASLLGGAELNWIDLFAVILWLIGFGFEAIGDQQLASFRANPTNYGKVFNQGLWRYTRHPNYFGEACIWWSYYLFAVATGGWWTILSPILMTFLILHVSGIALLERDIVKRRPAYRDYIRQTNAFFPGPPRSISLDH